MIGEIPSFDSRSEIVGPSESAAFAASHQPWNKKGKINGIIITSPISLK